MKIEKKILDHFLKFSKFTNPGKYKFMFDKLSGDIKKAGPIFRNSVIHPVCLSIGRKSPEAVMKYGDMRKVSKFRQKEDDYLPTVVAMLSELHNRDENGLTLNRKEKDRIIVSCRFVSLLVASFLKSKGIPARVRSGFAPYFQRIFPGKTVDHWVVEYWNGERWVLADIDGIYEIKEFDPYDIPRAKFDFSADSWLKVRKGKLDEKKFWSAGGFSGLMPISWGLFYDFHSLMNNEIIYLHVPEFIWGKFGKLSKNDLEEIDNLATLMKEPDKNFDELVKIWETKEKFRMLKGALL